MFLCEWAKQGKLSWAWPKQVTAFASICSWNFHTFEQLRGPALQMHPKQFAPTLIGLQNETMEPFRMPNHLMNTFSRDTHSPSKQHRNAIICPRMKAFNCCTSIRFAVASSIEINVHIESTVRFSLFSVDFVLPCFRPTVVFALIPGTLTVSKQTSRHVRK